MVHHSVSEANFDDKYFPLKQGKLFIKKYECMRERERERW